MLRNQCSIEVFALLISYIVKVGNWLLKFRNSLLVTHFCISFNFFIFPLLYWCLPFLYLIPFLHFTSGASRSGASFHTFSPMSWSQLHTVAMWQAPLPSLSTNHSLHHPLYNKKSTCCLASFLDCLTLADKTSRLPERPVTNYQTTLCNIQELHCSAGLKYSQCSFVQ